MIDLNEIESTIALLESGETTFSNCEKLAMLYICRDNIQTRLNPVPDTLDRELTDILPYYMKYRDIKKRYQLNQAIDNEVIQGIEDVCREVKEFIDTLYYCTDMNKERVCIRDMINDLHDKYRE